MRTSSLVCAFIGAASVNALPTIEAIGNKFFTSDGKQFFMKGTDSFVPTRGSKVWLGS